MQKSQFGEQIWQFFGEIFPEYIQKYGKLYTYYTTCICILSKNKRVYIHCIVEIYIHVSNSPADNTFNSFSRIQMMWNVRHARPAGTWFAFNCYKHWSFLMVCEPGSCSSATIYSKEGVPQGGPFVMVMYDAIGTLRIQKQAIDAYHSWYEDDSSVVGRFPDLKRICLAMCMWGVSYGYIPNSSKTKIIVPEHRLAAAQQYFNTESRLKFEVQSDARYLGGLLALLRCRTNM